MDAVKNELLKHIGKLEDLYSLQFFSPLGSGGVADFYTKVEDTIELATAVKAAIDLKIPYLVVGEAEKVLFSDSGFPGLLIHNMAKSYAIALDKSQIVVDSGVQLSEIIAVATSRGLGGITNFYGCGGTVGGALFSNIAHENTSFISLLRYITMIVPPARIDTEAKIIRYKYDWLQYSDTMTKLQHLREAKGLETQPVILSALLQLTSVRTDELMIRIGKQATDTRMIRPKNKALGPLFRDDSQESVSELLIKSQAFKLRVGDLYLDRQYPNFMRSKTITNRARDIRQLISLVQAHVRDTHGIDLVCRYEFVGMW